MSREWDLFFYYGMSELEDEIQQDIINGVGTSKNKLFFNRSDSAGVNDFENTPSSLAIEVSLKYTIIQWLAFRNTYTGDGNNGSKERRVASSQSQIQVENKKEGKIDISIFYIAFAKADQNNTLTIRLGV